MELTFQMHLIELKFKNNGQIFLYLQRFGASCSPDRAIIKMSTKHKLYILQIHNRMRNEIALGRIPGYETASRMPMLVSIYLQFLKLEIPGMFKTL